MASQATATVAFLQPVSGSQFAPGLGSFEASPFQNSHFDLLNIDVTNPGWEDIALPTRVTTESRLGLQPSVAFQVFLPFLQLFGLALFCFSSWHKSRHSYFETASSKNDQFRHICRTRLSGALGDGTLAFCLKQLNIFFSGLKIFSCQ